MISLLSPTRNRPNEILRLIDSVLTTADHPEEIELVLYIDEDDDSYDSILAKDQGIQIKHKKGPRIIVSDMWNKCYDIAEGPLYHHASDDFVYRSKGWDTIVKNTFDEWDDKILFLYGRDGHQDATLGTLGFLHKNWIETVGYFMPPYFVVDWCDTWINDVAEELGRRLYKSEIYTEHLHPDAGKSEMDQTYLERDAIRIENSGHSLYQELAPKREEDVQKLRKFIGK